MTSQSLDNLTNQRNSQCHIQIFLERYQNFDVQNTRVNENCMIRDPFPTFVKSQIQTSNHYKKIEARGMLNV